MFYPPVFVTGHAAGEAVERSNALRRLLGLPPLARPAQHARAFWATIYLERRAARANWMLVGSSGAIGKLLVRGACKADWQACASESEPPGMVARASALVALRPFVVGWWGHVEAFRKDAELQRALQIQQEDELLLLEDEVTT